MKKIKTEDFLERETALALKVATKLIEKPKISMMVVIFPFLLINFIQDLRIYRYKREFFLKEYLFLKKTICELLKEKELSDTELEERIESIIVKDNKYSELYRCQIDEGIAIKKYLTGERDEMFMRSKEIETLKRTIEILKLNGDALETSQKLLNILI
ncbi:hypothetical protein [uncultured Cetobacterium sp.]|uniref:hypothetical protein n=1 Tax=uncultured Cetobacterium sp. TaxID=527638 RepID=UPI0025DB853B|nr:hypothetical protein [uncultured Cetobacterium sp.]